MAAKNSTPENTTRCIRCSRVLTSATSLRKGMGKGCAAKIRKAAADLTEFKAHQIESARELIEDQGIAHIRNNIFATVSTDGDRIHRSTTDHCTCHAGLKNKACFHTAAVRMFVADLTVARPFHALAA